jgi:tetratricopeptide (TPR) repeat protein
MDEQVSKEAKALYDAGRTDEAEALIMENVDADLKDLELYYFYSQCDDNTKTIEYFLRTVVSSIEDWDSNLEEQADLFADLLDNAEKNSELLELVKTNDQINNFFVEYELPDGHEYASFPLDSYPFAPVLARYYYLTGEYDRALEICSVLLTADNRECDPVGVLVLKAIENKNDDFISEINEYIDIDQLSTFVRGRLLYYKGREDEGMQLIKKASKRKGVWKTDAELFLLDNDSSAEDVPSEAIPVPDEELETVVEPTSPSASPKRQSRHKKKSGSRKKKGGIIKSIKRFLWKVFR